DPVAMRTFRAPGLGVYGSPEAAWFASPFIAAIGSNDPHKKEDGSKTSGTSTNTSVDRPGPITLADYQQPVTITIKLRELLPGNPIARFFGGILPGSRTQAIATWDPQQRAAAQTARRATEVQDAAAIGGAVTNYCNASADAGTRYTARRT